MSLFSTLNNLDDISLDDEYCSICGFTEMEINHSFAFSMGRLATATGVKSEEASVMIKRKYDGYHFSPSCVDIYNPFSFIRK